jgi:hypothetical protein
MGALTQNERDGLDEVFLSIHSKEDKLEKMKNLALLFTSHKSTQNFSKLFNRAKHGLKETKLSHFLLQYTKKKKNLSK